MNPVLFAYGSLAVAILCEVAASSFLQKSEQFTRLAPTLAMAALYGVSFFFLAQALKGMPLGVAYAIWAGAGIVLVSLAGLIFFRQALDVPAMIGIVLIVAGVVVMQAFSKTTGH